MSFTALHLAQFKAFGARQVLPLRPLTLIYGTNSAGKSSVIHGLLWAHQAIATGELDAYRTLLGGESLDLGGFGQFVYGRDRRRSVEWGCEVASPDLVPPLGSGLGELISRGDRWALRLWVGLDSLQPDGQPEIQGVCWAIDDQPVLVAWADHAPETTIQILSELLAPDFNEIDCPNADPVATTFGNDFGPSPLASALGLGRLRCRSIAWDHPVLAHLVETVLQVHRPDQVADEKELGLALRQLTPQLAVRIERWLPWEMVQVGDRGRSPGSDRGQPAVALASLANLAGRFRQSLAGILQIWLPQRLGLLLNFISQAAADQLNHLDYLGPFRSYPPRHFGTGRQQDANWLSGGGTAWQRLLTDSATRSQVNHWLTDATYMKTPYELVVQTAVTTETAIACLAEALTMTLAESEPIPGQNLAEAKEAQALLADRWLDLARQALEQAQTDHTRELVLIDRRSNTAVSHRDIGIGVSQILPILVSALASTESTVAIEQPELHLHPRLQAEIADVFIESALGDRHNSFILETHSEHLLLRIMRRLRESSAGTLPPGVPPLKPSDVAILYVEPDGPQSIVQELPLNAQGELVKAWPGGFFEEGLEELFA